MNKSTIKAFITTVGIATAFVVVCSYASTNPPSLNKQSITTPDPIFLVDFDCDSTVIKDLSLPLQYLIDRGIDTIKIRIYDSGERNMQRKQQNYERERKTKRL